MLLTLLILVEKLNIRTNLSNECYGPSVISVTVTKGGHPKGSRLYRTSGTMRRGVAKLYS